MPQKKQKPRVITMPDGQKAELADDVGRVTLKDGQALVCQTGLIVRLGLGANPGPAFCASLYPHLELCPGEERSKAGEQIGGLPVFCWVGQAMAAKLMGITTRQVANLEVKGLPHEGHGPTKRYPLPHLHIWNMSYRHRLDVKGETVRRLPFELALAEHEVEQARERVRSLGGAD